jgi:hypothetical protein
LLKWKSFDRRDVLETGIVDKDVDPSVRPHQCVDHRRDIGGVAHVAADRAGRAACGADALGNRLRRVQTQVLN